MTSTIWQIVLLSMSLVAGGLAIVELGSAVRQGVASLRTTSEQTASKLAEFHRRFEAAAQEAVTGRHDASPIALTATGRGQAFDATVTVGAGGTADMSMSRGWRLQEPLASQLASLTQRLDRELDRLAVQRQAVSRRLDVELGLLREQTDAMSRQLTELDDTVTSARTTARKGALLVALSLTAGFAAGLVGAFG